MTSVMSRRRPLAVAAAGALLAVAVAYALVQAAPAFAATSANVWLTTPDQQNRLTPQQPVPFGSGGSGPVITVDPTTTYQTMVGFGASLTDSAAWNIYNSSARDSIMTSLFSPTNGIGLSWLRQPLGATDFSRSFYSYDDGSRPPSPTTWSSPCMPTRRPVCRCSTCPCRTSRRTSPAAIPAC